jgi:hypothetical protein
MAKYAWRPNGAQPPISADAFGLELERLAKGRPVHFVPPKEVVAAARPKSSPIHDAFEWVDKVAADQRRLETARHLCNSLQIVRVEVRNGTPVSPKALFSVRIAGQRGYATQDHIRGDRDLSLQVLQNARNELQSYINKFIGVTASFGQYVSRLQEIVDEMQDQIDQMTTEAGSRRQTGPHGPTASPPG